MPALTLEKNLYLRNLGPVAGIDEAGRGPLAGPVVAAAVILPADLAGNEDWLEVIDDSKRLSPIKRENAANLIYRHACDVSVAAISPAEIDRVGIGNACINAMMSAARGLAVHPEYLLLDYVPIKECPYRFQTVVKGDASSYSIAAASIIAKVTRDKYMVGISAEYPQYGFAQHKGYPTASHLEKLSQYGPCPIHRRSFQPVKIAAIKSDSGR